MSPTSKNPLFLKMLSDKSPQTSPDDRQPEVISLLTPPSKTHQTNVQQARKLKFPSTSSPANTRKLLSKEEAILAVKSILSDQQCQFYLVSFDKLKGKNLKSPVYEHYDLLCHVNTNTSAGWSVCKYLYSSCCALEKGCQKFDTENGTTNMKRHQKNHETAKSQATHVRKIGSKAKRILCRAASMAVVEDLRPFVFAEGTGMRKFIRCVFEAGQAVAIGENIDHSDYLPYSRRIRETVSELCANEKAEFKRHLSSIMKVGSAMTVDGVTMTTQDKHFYDLTLHYFEIQDNDPFCIRVPELMCKTIVLAESTKGNSAFEVKSLVSEKLFSHYQLNFDTLMESFTLVTDWAAVMPNIVGASVSENIAPMDEKWMGCIVHQLNTIMKTCLTSCELDPVLSRVSNDLVGVKNMVRIFKQSKWNHELSDGYHLIQEIETRFATTYEVAKRFLRSGQAAFAIVDKRNSEPAKLAKQSILQRKDPGSNLYGFPCVEAIVDACDMIVYTQTKLEASLTPTVHLVLPLLETCKKALLRIEEGAPVNRGFSRGSVPPSEYSVRLCQVMRETLTSKIRVHDLWIAGCILHPFLRELQFIDIVERENYLARGMKTVRKLLNISERRDVKEQGGNDRTITASSTGQRSHVCQDSVTIEPSSSLNSNPNMTKQGLKRKFDQIEYADSHFGLSPEMEHDELGKYLQTDILKYRLH